MFSPSGKTDNEELNRSYDMNLLVHIARQKEWSNKTFGPGDRTEGIIDHIIKEIVEVKQCHGQDLGKGSV